MSRIFALIEFLGFSLYTVSFHIEIWRTYYLLCNPELWLFRLLKARYRFIQYKIHCLKIPLTTFWGEISFFYMSTKWRCFLDVFDTTVFEEFLIHSNIHHNQIKWQIVSSYLSDVFSMILLLGKLKKISRIAFHRVFPLYWPKTISSWKYQPKFHKHFQTE